MTLVNPFVSFPASSGPTYSAEVLADGPVGYWPMDEASGTTMADASGNGRNLTLTNAVAGTRTPTPFAGVSPDFDGNGDYASSSSVTWWSGSSGVSIECWAYVDAAVGSMPGGINSFFGDLTNTTNGCLIRANSVSAGTLPLNVYFGTASGLRSLAANYTVATGTVLHIVATYDAATIRLYVNGAEVATNAQTGTATFNMATRVASSEGGRWLDGTVHHCALYNSVLSAGRVAAHYAAAA